MKNCMLLTKNSPHPVDMYFRTTQALAKVQEGLMEELPQKSQEMLLDGVDTRVVVDVQDILMLYHSREQLELSGAPCPVSDISILFQGGRSIRIPVFGPRRANAAFKTLQMLFKREPTNRVLMISQDEGKKAFLRHSEVIVQLTMEEDNL